MSTQRLALAIARDRTDLGDFAGIGRHARDGLAILHAQVPVDVLAPGLETLQDYAATVARLHATETILPLRFGSLHDSPATLDDWLRVRGDDWRAALDDVEGCDEIGLRVLLDPPASPGPIVASSRPGTAYLRALKARHDVSETVLAEASRVAQRLRDALEGTYRRAIAEDPGPGRERLLSLAYLVPRPRLDRFHAIIGPLAAGQGGKILLTGPWPPYSFAGA